MAQPYTFTHSQSKAFCRSRLCFVNELQVDITLHHHPAVSAKPNPHLLYMTFSIYPFQKQKPLLQKPQVRGVESDQIQHLLPQMSQTESQGVLSRCLVQHLMG